jgi:hypothetical protein
VSSGHQSSNVFCNVIVPSGVFIESHFTNSGVQRAVVRNVGGRKWIHAKSLSKTKEAWFSPDLF